MKFGNTQINFDQDNVINVKTPVFIEAFILGMNMYYDHLKDNLSIISSHNPGNSFAKIIGIKWARAICSQTQPANLKDVKESFEAGMEVATARYQQENPYVDDSVVE